VVFSAAAAPTAHALLPQTILSKTDDVAALFERGGIPNGRTPVNCGPVCDDLWLSEHRPMPNQTASDELHRELRKARTRGGRVLPKLGGAGGVLGTVALGASSFVAGWQIGTAVRSIWVHETLPADPSVDVYGVKLRDKGDDPAGFAQPAGYLPVDAWVATSNSSGTTYYVTSCNSVDPTQTLNGFAHITFMAAPSTCGGLKARYFYRPVTMRPPRESKEDGAVQQGERIDWPTGTQGTNGESATVTRDRIIQDLSDNEAEYPTLIPWLDSQLGGQSSDPTGATVKVPGCSGDLYLTCAAKLQGAGLVPERSTLTPAQADLTKPADAVITLNPSEGANVENGSTVVVLTNPDTATMPITLPAPGANETYEAYAARLRQLGFTGTITRSDLSPELLDPARGAGEAVRTQPATCPRCAPSTAITVYTNPGEAPAAGGGLFTPPAVPAVNFDPLGQASPCNVFPFGVPCWVVSLIDKWAGTPVIPEWDFHFPMAGDGENWNVSLAILDPYMGAIRAIVGVMAIVGMLWIFYGVAHGGSVPAGNRDGD
jgi:hypothetical protein